MEHGHAGGASEFSLLLPFLIFIIVITPLTVWLLARRTLKHKIDQSLAVNEEDNKNASPASHRYDLLQIGWVHRMLKSRVFQFAFQLPNFIIFMIVIIAGIWGTQLGDKNFATVFTWLIWWA
ncbi:MAG: hypothetical protein Q7K29_08625, partial [Thermoleophilia bacterium]|nr:hypothetical protein [Thermoleophilia bacterium]